MKTGLYIDKKSKADLERKLRLISDIDKNFLPERLKMFVKNSANDIKKDAPVDTGNLKQQVNGEMTGRLSGTISSIALGDNKFDYAPIQEFGSVHRDPKPYFYPNIRQNYKAMISGLKAGIKRIVNK